MSVMVKPWRCKACTSMNSSWVIISVPSRSVVLGRRQTGRALTTQGGFPALEERQRLRSHANPGDHLSRSSLIADRGLLLGYGRRSKPKPEDPCLLNKGHEPIGSWPLSGSPPAT